MIIVTGVKRAVLEGMTTLGAAETESDLIDGISRRVWRIGWRLAGFFGLLALLLALTALLGDWLRELGERSPAEVRFFFDCAGLVTVLLAGWIMAHWVDRKAPEFSWAGGSAPWREGLGGLIGGAIWLAVSLSAIGLFGAVSYAPAGEVVGPALGLAAVSLGLNAVVQEVLGRGYLWQVVQRSLGPVWALVGSAALFTALHVAAFHGVGWPMLNVFLAGMLLGLLRWRSGGLLAPIGVHYAWNFLAGPGLGLTVSSRDLTGGWRVFVLDGPVAVTGGEFGLEGSVLVTGVTAIACGVLWWPLLKQRTQTLG